jgi:hypothetical protein
MRFFHRLWRWLFPTPFGRLLQQARHRGRVTLAQVDLPKGVGWYASIRPHGVGRGPHAHNYSWTGESVDLAVALQDAVEEANNFPIMVDMTEDRCAPKLGGDEFDPEL